MFPMTITLHTPGQLSAIMALLAASPQEPTTAELVQIAQARGAEVKKEAAEPSGKSAQSGKADPARTSPTATEAAAGAQQKTASESGPSAGSAEAEPQASTAATEPVTYDQVAKAITEAAKSNREKVVATLGKFGAKRGTELKAEQFAEFLAALA